jgi:hypothetical protein
MAARRKTARTGREWKGPMNARAAGPGALDHGCGSMVSRTTLANSW